MINEDYAAGAIRDNFPQLKVRAEDVEHIGTGFDNVAFRVKGKYIFRFSNEVGPWDKSEREIRLLPMLEKALAIPIPHVEYAALAPNGRYFMGYRMIEGVSFTKNVYESLNTDERAEMMDTLGKFLRGMFAFPVDEARKLQIPERDMREWHTRIWNRAEPHLEANFTPEEQEKLRQAFDTYFADEKNFEYTPSLVNTDLQAYHILFDENKKEFSGVIDWTDISIADPAMTFPIIYRSYGEGITRELLKRTIGESQMDKVKFLALATSLRKFVARKEEGYEERSQKQLRFIKQDLATY
jgi:aminoglycoside 2''-phosphotransferase